MDIKQIYDRLTQAYPEHERTILSTMPVAHVGAIHTLRHSMTGKQVSYDEDTGRLSGTIEGRPSQNAGMLLADLRQIERAA